MKLSDGNVITIPGLVTGCLTSWKNRQILHFVASGEMGNDMTITCREMYPRLRYMNTALGPAM